MPQGPAAPPAPQRAKAPLPAQKPVDVQTLNKIALASQPRLIYPSSVIRVFGSFQAIGGGFEALGGGVAILSPAPLGTKLTGGFMIAHGTDQFFTGLEMIRTGKATPTYTYRLSHYAATSIGADPEWANAIGQSADVAANALSFGASLQVLSTPRTLAPMLSADGEAAGGAGRLYRWWYRGSEYDAEWRSWSLSKKFKYEIGQKTLSDSDFSKVSGLDPIARGNELWKNNKIHALFTGYGNLHKTWGTGPTPVIRFLGPRILIGGGAAARGTTTAWSFRSVENDSH
jgi:hypothetical protein